MNARDSALWDLLNAVREDQGFYFSSCGWPRRPYLSIRDAAEFDRGWGEYDPMQTIPEQMGPYRDGWLSRACEQDEDQTTRDDERFDAMEEE